MSPVKLSILAVYVLLAGLATLGGGSTASVVSSWILAILAAAHLVEMIVFFGLCKAAQGSLVGHLLQVFLFGVFHAKELKGMQR
mgnify:CR=1 FL=1